MRNVSSESELFSDRFSPAAILATVDSVQVTRQQRHHESYSDTVPAISKAAAFPRLLLRVQYKDQSVELQTLVLIGGGYKSTDSGFSIVHLSFPMTPSTSGRMFVFLATFPLRGCHEH